MIVRTVKQSTATSTISQNLKTMLIIYSLGRLGHLLYSIVIE